MRLLKLVAILALFASCAFAQKQAPLPKDLPPYGPEKTLEAPSVKIAKLDNGLTVWLVSKPGFPKLSYAVAVRGGFAADPNDRPGISELLSNTIDQGTKSRKARKIAEEFQGAGGDLSAAAYRDNIEVSTTVLADKAEAAIAVLADVLQNATFPDDEVALAKKNLADSLQQQEADPSFLASRAVAKVLFGADPYHVISPTQESVAASTSADLRKIYAQRFRPDEAVFIAVGDFQNEKMLELVKANFGSWKAPAESPISRDGAFQSCTDARGFSGGAGGLGADDDRVCRRRSAAQRSGLRVGGGGECDLRRDVRLALDAEHSRGQGLHVFAFYDAKQLSGRRRFYKSRGCSQRGHRRDV